MRFSLSVLLALPLALAIPSQTSPNLTTRAGKGLLARTSGHGGLGGGDNVVCGTIPINKKKYICACFDLGDNTCYTADSKKDDNVVEDDGLISTVIKELEVTASLCYLPKNAKPDFTKGCCIYRCKDGFKDCGDKCVKQHKVCPSSKPHNSWKRALLERHVVASKCPTGLTACAVNEKLSYECLNTEKDIESCGGCIRGANATGSIGQDCTTLPNVGEVTCLAGQCQIQSCSPGFELNEEGTHCTYSDAAFRIQQKYRL